MVGHVGAGLQTDKLAENVIAERAGAEAEVAGREPGIARDVVEAGNAVGSHRFLDHDEILDGLLRGADAAASMELFAREVMPEFA